MALATVANDIVPVFESPDSASLRSDEILYGMSANIIQELDNGFCYIKTEFRTQGFAPSTYFEKNEEIAASWRKYEKVLVLAPYIDVNISPEDNSACMLSVPRASLLVALAKPDESGWQKVGMASGQIGYTRASYLGEVISDWRAIPEENMRWNIVETALSYNGTAWRTGGRTTLGIDAVGLAAMTYNLNGVNIPRENFFKTGEELNLIDSRALAEGDLIYFQNSIGIYLGEGKFIHSTTLNGTEGVIINSLRQKDDDFRPDLAASVAAIASLY